MNRVKERKFNNLYWTYTVVAICMLIFSPFEWTAILSTFIVKTSITFYIFV